MLLLLLSTVLYFPVQPPSPLVSVAGLQQCDKGCIRGRGAGHVPLPAHFLLLVRRELARPRPVLAAAEVDQGRYWPHGDYAVTTTLLL